MYYQKYLKYKQKYLLLKQLAIKQTGGHTPDISILKNISLFPKDDVIDDFLNPIYGAYWNISGAIENYYRFQSNDPISILIRKTFTMIEVTSEVKLTESLSKNFTVDDFAKFLSYLYLKKTFSHVPLRTIDDKQYGIKELIKNIEELKLANEEKVLIINKNVKKHYDNNFVKIKINELDDRISLDIPPQNPENKHAELLHTLKEYLKETEKITVVPTFENNIKEYFPDTYTKILSPEVFYVILSALWWKLNNKQGIYDYYASLNKYLLNSMKITIPPDYVNMVYIEDDLKPDVELKSFEHTLASIYKNMYASIKLFNQDWVNYTKNICVTRPKPTCTTRADFNCTFPDCGESVLRSFINIIVFSKEERKFSQTILEKLGAIKEVKDFYRTFDTIEKQLDPNATYKINDELTLNARDAWGLIVSNKPGIKYIDKCTLHTGSEYKYEINSGIDEEGNINMIALMKKLLEHMPELNNKEAWSELGIDIQNNLNNDSGLGYIIISNLLGTYVMNFIPGHYEISQRIKSENFLIDYTNFIDKKPYIEILLRNDKRIKELFIESNKYKYLIKYNSDSLIKLFNECGNEIDDDMYNIIFDYMIKNYDHDKLRRIYVRLSKIKIIDVSKMKKVNIQITLVDNKMSTTDKSEVIGFNNVTNCDFVAKFTNLQTLKFGHFFDKDLGNCLNNLTNLQTLIFDYYFDRPLLNSLDNLKNLRSLEFGYKFNQPLLQSLDNLKNLHSLKFGYEFNQPLLHSLDNLKNLQHLIFGDYFDQPLADIIDMLPNLRTLELGNKFRNQNDELFVKLTRLETLKLGPGAELRDDSLLVLTSLRTLNLSELRSQSFMYPNRELADDSLYTLTKLENLFLPNSHTKRIKNLLGNLTNLQSLILGYDFNVPLLDSLYGLTNLKKLEFGAFNRSLEQSLCKLDKLETLKFGAFNKKFDNSLEKLTNLRTLELGSHYDQPLENSLNELTNLQNLTFSLDFNFPLKDSLKKLTNLQNLTFGFMFDKPLGDSLENLTNLQNLTFGENFNEPLENSLKNLTNLLKLTFKTMFDQPLENSLEGLTKLEYLILNKRFDKPLDKLKTKLPNLKIIKE